MFEFIIGDVVSIEDDYIVLQNNGIGYKLNTSINSMLKLEIGMKNAMIYTYLAVREDGLFLYGFTSREEIDMFKLLLLVSKVGPKTALGVLSTLTPNQIKISILNRELNILCKAPGIGKKTAERMVLELKDRINKDEIITISSEEEVFIDNYDEALEGLISLGYTKLEVERVIRNLDISKMSVEHIIRETLKLLSRN